MEKFAYLIFLIGIGMLASVSSSRLSRRSEFGESCNKTVRCSGSAWLICTEGICSCAKKDEMIYDKMAEKCVSKSGERCRYEIDTDMKIFEKSECVTNANCGVDGICNCKDEFYETLNGTCLRKGEHRDACASDLECRSDMFLVCLDNFCQCNCNVSEYSLHHNHCVGLGGHPCIKEECTEYAKCQNGICGCSSSESIELFQHESGKCIKKKGYSELCKSDNECKQTNIFLSCVDGKCGCAPELSNYELARIINWDYDDHEEKFECAGLAGKPCNPNRNCVKNSQCNDYGECSCIDSYKKTSKGRCGKDYDQTCDSSDEVCADEFTCRANTNTCTCKSLTQSTYSFFYGKCQSLAFGPCQINNDCIASTYCVKHDNEQGRTGYCNCRAGFVENSRDTCDLAFGSACPSTGYVCDKLASLECLNGKCACTDISMLYDHKSRKCLGLVGFTCSEGSCVENAFCHVEYPGLPGHCRCIHGFNETSERICSNAVALVKDVNSDLLEQLQALTDNLKFSNPNMEDKPGTSTQVMKEDLPTESYRRETSPYEQEYTEYD